MNKRNVNTTIEDIYCKNKDKCDDYHPNEDCRTKCTEKGCVFRHRSLCKYKEYCYHNINGKCEYVHVTSDDEIENEAHRVILSATSDKTEYEKDKEKVDILEHLNQQYKGEIDQDKTKINELKNEIERKNKEIKIEKDRNKKEIEKVKSEHEEEILKYKKSIDKYVDLVEKHEKEIKELNNLNREVKHL